MYNGSNDSLDINIKKIHHAIQLEKLELFESLQKKDTPIHYCPMCPGILQIEGDSNINNKAFCPKCTNFFNKHGNRWYPIME